MAKSKSTRAKRPGNPRQSGTAAIGVKRAVALLDVLIAKVDYPDYSEIDVLRKVVRRLAIQSREELLGEVSP